MHKIQTTIRKAKKKREKSGGLTEKAVTVAPINPKMKTPQSLISWAFFSFLSLSSLFISESNSIISHSTITVTNYSTIQTHTLFLSLNFSKYQIPKLFSSLSTAIAIYFFFSLFSSFCSTNSPESVRLLILLIRISSMTWHRIIQFREL